MSDIVDGLHYKHLLEQESDAFITLTINTDGIQPYCNAEKSIWPVTLVVNEIDRKKRYSFQNLIIAGVWPGPSKPKRDEMSSFLGVISNELTELEQGFYYECRLNSTWTLQFLKVFVICACLDKPAQALVQNLAEPIAKYGCGRCEIRG